MSASVVGAPVGTASASFTLFFSLTTGLMKELLSINKKQKEKTVMLPKSELDSIETLVCQALIDMKISHEEFNAVVMEKQKMRGCKKMWGMSVKNKKMWDCPRH